MSDEVFIGAVKLDHPLPTHKCPTCGTLWRYWSAEECGSAPGGFNLRSLRSCEHGVYEPLTVADIIELREWLQEVGAA